MSDLPKLFAALSDQTRFAIVERLMSEGELPAAQIQGDFPISPPAISRHLSVLRKAGIVARRVDKQRRLYRVCPEAIEEINAWAISHRDFWEKSLERLEAALLAEMEKK